MFQNCKCQDGSVQWDDITETACFKYFQADHLLANAENRCGEVYPYYAGDLSHQVSRWSIGSDGLPPCTYSHVSAVRLTQVGTLVHCMVIMYR